MKTVIANTSKYIYVLLLSGAVALTGCSNKSDTNQDSSKSEAKTEQTESAESEKPDDVASSVAKDSEPKEMALVVQNFGMSKFSQFKRFYDIGYALFSIHADGTVSSGTSSGLSDFKLDWTTAVVNNYGAKEIAFRTPAIKKIEGGQTLPPQEITIARTVESKLKLNQSEKNSEVFTIETLVLDSARTICVLGVSSQ